jgi:ammonia channel protein AmtB
MVDTAVIPMILKVFMNVRPTAEEEYMMGIDAAEHGETAYKETKLK